MSGLEEFVSELALVLASTLMVEGFVSCTALELFVLISPDRPFPKLDSAGSGCPHEEIWQDVLSFRHPQHTHIHTLGLGIMNIMEGVVEQMLVKISLNKSCILVAYPAVSQPEREN